MTTTLTTTRSNTQRQYLDLSQWSEKWSGFGDLVIDLGEIIVVAAVIEAVSTSSSRSVRSPASRTRDYYFYYYGGYHSRHA